MRSLGGLSRSGTLLNSLLTSKRTFSGDITANRSLTVTAAKTVELKILRHMRKASGRVVTLDLKEQISTGPGNCEEVSCGKQKGSGVLGYFQRSLLKLKHGPSP